jgi:branched-chain amino acid aminotransferase
MAGGGPYPHVFHDGQWTHAGAAVVPVGSLALRYGLSVFEGIRLYRQHGGGVRPFLLERHLRRLRDSLTLMRLTAPDVDKVPAIVDDLVARNGVGDDAYVRVAVTPTTAGLLDAESTTALTVTVTPMGRKQWLSSGAGMRLQISGWQRAPEQAFPSAAKNISGYAGPRLALLEAKQAGYDGCVLTNLAGRLCEAPTAAVFLVRDGVLRTPALDEGVLPSITRQWVLAGAGELGIPAETGRLTRADAVLADEAFLCGTGIEFAPVCGFDSGQCRSWPQNPVTRRIVDRYFADVRHLPEEEE